MQTNDSFTLNPDLIESCNAESDFNTGNVIVQEATNSYNGFYNMVKSFGKLNKRQATYVEAKKAEWKNLVEQVYNEELTRRAKIIPLNIKLKHTIAGGQKLNDFITATVMELKRLAK